MSQDWRGAGWRWEQEVETSSREVAGDVVGFDAWVGVRGKARGELEVTPALNLNARSPPSGSLDVCERRGKPN